jgi:signal transduction histidine kinase
MPTGGELMIRTHLGRRGVSGDGAGYVMVDISDTGGGIPPENMPRIFDAYFTTKKGGTGLGLPTTRRIIEEHQGHITVTSEPGRGTNFRVELPLAQTPADPAETPGEKT